MRTKLYVAVLGPLGRLWAALMSVPPNAWLQLAFLITTLGMFYRAATGHSLKPAVRDYGLIVAMFCWANRGELWPRGSREENPEV